MTNASQQLQPAAEPTSGPRSIAAIIADLSRPVNPQRLKTRKATASGGQQLTYIPWYQAVRYKPMPTIFLSGGAPRVIYRVMTLKNGKWSPFTNYTNYQDAELAACGLITGGKATEAHILEIRASGRYDSLSYPVPDDAETVTWPVSVTDKETYRRSTLSLADVSIVVYVHESLTPEQALNRLVESYKAWAVNMPGGRW